MDFPFLTQHEADPTDADNQHIRNGLSENYPLEALHQTQTHPDLIGKVLFAGLPAAHSQHSQIFNIDQYVLVPSMAPPASKRKRKAPTLRREAWEPYKDRIRELHVSQNLPLEQVKIMIEQETGFNPELRQYRTRVSQWGFDKNVKPEEMKSIVRKRQRRRLVETDQRELAFEVRGALVPPAKIDRWMKRNGIGEGAFNIQSPTASTPSAIGCWTNSDRGTPAPSPSNGPGSPNVPTNELLESGQGHNLASSRSPISTFYHSLNSPFTGQSPASVYQTVPSSTTSVELLPGTTVSPLKFQPQDLASPDPRVGKHQASMEPICYKYTEGNATRQRLFGLEEYHGKGHPETLSTVHELVRILIDQGRYRYAEEVIQPLVTAHYESTEGKHPGALGTFALFGELLMRQGRLSEAENVLQSAFNNQITESSREHPDALGCTINLAVVYLNQGRYKEAEELGTRATETSRRVLGHEHPATLISVGDLASVYRKQGRLKEAESLGLQVIKQQQSNLGDQHPFVLRHMANLALVYHDQGRLKEAEELGMQVLEKGQKILGHGHPDTLIYMSNLAAIYRDQGRMEEAEVLNAQVAEIRDRVASD